MAKNINDDIFSASCYIAANILVGTVATHLVTVSFGASLWQDMHKTLIFSALVALVVFVVPAIFVTRRRPGHHWTPQSTFDMLVRLYVAREFTAANSNTERIVANLGTGCVIGAWTGALVIPLDWDRWWQEWPVSCVLGALFGSLASLLYSLVGGDRWWRRALKKAKLHL